MTHTKKLALSGIFAGLSLALMWVFSFVPSLEYAIPALAGMISLLIVLELNYIWAIAMYGVAAVLSCLMLPVKGIAILYTMFFGYYPILKSLLEAKLPKWLSWICKFAAFNVTMISTYFLVTKVFGIELENFGEVFEKYANIFMLVIGNAAFFVYDLLVLSTFTMLYQRRWRKKMMNLMH